MFGGPVSKKDSRKGPRGKEKPQAQLEAQAQGGSSRSHVQRRLLQPDFVELVSAPPYNPEAALARLN